MAELTEVFQVTETVGTTEHSFTTDTAGPDLQTTPGTYIGFFDVSALAAGDEFMLRVYEKVSSGGTQRVIHEATLIGAQAIPIYKTPEFDLMHGWDFTWDKIAGTDRSIIGSIRQRTYAATADIAAIKAKTDNLPSDPADQSLIIAATDAIIADTNDIQTRLPAALVGGRMASNAEVVGDKTGYALVAAEHAAIADKTLGRSIAGGADGGRTVTSALRTLRNKQEIVLGTLTVYMEDDLTPAFTAAIGTAPSDPINSIDPA